MDSIRVSEAPDTGSIPVEATKCPVQRIPGADVVIVFPNHGFPLLSPIDSAMMRVQPTSYYS